MAVLCLAVLITLGMVLNDAHSFRFLLLSTIPGLLFFVCILLNVVIGPWLIYGLWHGRVRAWTFGLAYAGLYLILIAAHLWVLRGSFERMYIEGAASLSFVAHARMLGVLCIIWSVVIGILAFTMPSRKLDNKMDQHG